MDARDSEIASLYLAGSTLARVGEIYGISKERVRQVLVELGIKTRGAGRPPRKKRPRYRAP